MYFRELISMSYSAMLRIWRIQSGGVNAVRRISKIGSGTKQKQPTNQFAEGLEARSFRPFLHFKPKQKGK
jgi:hypothetical protein